MKLKSRPEDFRVTELAEWDEDPQGDHRVYRITKTKMTTFEAVDRIREAVGLSGEGVSYAGLKDKQAVATQHIAIKGRDLRGRVDGLRHTFVGRTTRPLGSRNLRGNRFRIVVRRLLPGPAEAYREVAHETAARGLPNYFDDQRFGSIRAGQGFAGRAMLRGEYERALELLLALPGQYDPPGERARKHKIRELWGEWRTLARELRSKKQKPLIDALAKSPGDFASALDALPTRERAVHLLAYQAYLWNECVGRLLTLLLPARTLCEAPYSCDRHIFWTAPDNAAAKAVRESLSGLEMPLLGPRTKIHDDAVGEAIAETLEAEGLTLPQFRLEGLEHAFMKEVSRPLILTPDHFEVGEVELDELASKGEDLRKLTLSFTLPPGAYATLVIKRVFESVAFNPAHETDRSWHHVRVRDLGVLRRERAEEREAQKTERRAGKTDRRDRTDKRDRSKAPQPPTESSHKREAGHKRETRPPAKPGPEPSTPTTTPGPSPQQTRPKPSAPQPTSDAASPPPAASAPGPWAAAAERLVERGAIKDSPGPEAAAPAPPAEASSSPPESSRDTAPEATLPSPAPARPAEAPASKPDKPHKSRGDRPTKTGGDRPTKGGKPGKNPRGKPDKPHGGKPDKPDSAKPGQAHRDKPGKAHHDKPDKPHRARPKADESSRGEKAEKGAKAEKPRRPMGAARRILKKQKEEASDEAGRGGKPTPKGKPDKTAGKPKKKKKGNKKVRWKGLKAKRKRRDDRAEDDPGKPKKRKSKSRSKSGKSGSGKPAGRGGTRKREDRRSFKEGKGSTKTSQGQDKGKGKEGAGESGKTGESSGAGS